MTEQTRDEAMRARVASINTPEKALMALREVADIGRIFNQEMALTVGRAADVLERALPKVPRLTAEQLWAMQLLREEHGLDQTAAEQFARRITNGQLAPDAQGQTFSADVELLERLLASKRSEQRETSERWGGAS
jgi:hypothetical protein